MASSIYWNKNRKVLQRQKFQWLGEHASSKFKRRQYSKCMGNRVVQIQNWEWLAHSDPLPANQNWCGAVWCGRDDQPKIHLQSKIHCCTHAQFESCHLQSQCKQMCTPKVSVHWNGTATQTNGRSVTFLSALTSGSIIVDPELADGIDLWSFGQVITFSMWLLLATISFFLCFCPGRDTQANAFSDYGSVVPRPLLMLCALSNMSILSWIQATTNTLIFCEGEPSIALDFSFGRVFAVLVPFLFLRAVTISLSCVLDLGYTWASALCDTCTRHLGSLIACCANMVVGSLNLHFQLPGHCFHLWHCCRHKLQVSLIMGCI